MSEDRDEWRWFEVKNELYIYAESRDGLEHICREIGRLGTARFKTGQTKPCIELSVVEVKDDEQ
jgi:hypothetical protein